MKHEKTKAKVKATRDANNAKKQQDGKVVDDSELMPAAGSDSDDEGDIVEDTVHTGAKHS